MITCILFYSSKFSDLNIVELPMDTSQQQLLPYNSLFSRFSKVSLYYIFNLSTTATSLWQPFYWFHKVPLYYIFGPHHAKMCASADSKRPRSACISAQSDQDLHCPPNESLDTTECMNGEQRSGWQLAHMQDDVNLHFSPWRGPCI